MMADIDTERSESTLRVVLNRPTKKNAMTSSMYVALADILNGANQDDGIRTVLWHGAGDSFCAGNDVEDFLEESSRPGRISTSPADERTDRFRQAADCRRSRGRHRRWNHHADAL